MLTFLFLAYMHTVMPCWFFWRCPNTRALVLSVSARCWIWRVFDGVAGRVARRRLAARLATQLQPDCGSRLELSVSPWRGLWYSHDWVRAILYRPLTGWLQIAHASLEEAASHLGEIVAYYFILFVFVLSCTVVIYTRCFSILHPRRISFFLRRVVWCSGDEVKVKLSLCTP